MITRSARRAERSPGSAPAPDPVLLRACPRCAEQIRAEAKRCRYCLSDLDNQDRRPGAWLLTNLTVTIPLCTFLYVAFQVFKAADYEVNTAVELQRESGLTTILVGVLLVQLPIELLIAVLLWLAWLLSRPGETSTDRRTGLRAVLVGLVPVAMGVIISPWPLVAFSAAFLAVAALFVSIPRLGTPRRAVGIAYAVVGLALVVWFLRLPTIWMAAEDVTTKAGSHVVGYVVSSDSDWTTILRPTWTGRLPKGQNSLLRLKTSDVATRTACAIDFSDARAFQHPLHLRTPQLAHWLLGGGKPPVLTPGCPK